MLLFVIAITLHAGVDTGYRVMIFVVCVHFALEVMTFLPRVLTNNSNWFNDAMKRKKKYSHRSTTTICSAFTARHSCD